MPDISAHAARIQDEQRISKLDSDLHESVNGGECVPREHSNAANDTRLSEMPATLEVSEFVFQGGMARNEGEREVQEQQQISDDGLEQPQMQNFSLEAASVESDRAKDCTELLGNEDLNQGSRERAGTNPRLYDKQFRLSSPRKDDSLHQQIVTALEASELKVEEQSEKLKELETSMSMLKEQTSHLEKGCTTAETEAGESSSLLSQLQTKLDQTTMELSEAKLLNVQGDVMKLQLQEYETALSHAKAQRTEAESSVRELKFREDHIEMIERGNQELEVRLKWRNEQFQSLEEAHSKLRSQLKEKGGEWDKEKCGLFSDIDSLQSTLNSKENTLREMQNELQMVHHALSREQSRRKALELEAAENRRGLEQAEAGCKLVQTTLEALREQSSAEIGTLRNSLGTKDRQLKNLHVEHVHMEQKYNELKEMEKEYRTWQSNHGEQQQQLLSLKERMSSAVEANDNLRSRMKALEEDFEKERRGLLTAIDEAYDHVSSRDGTQKQLDSDLDRAEGTVEHAQGHCSSLDERKETRALNQSFSDTSIRKDVAIEKRVLKAGLRQKGAVIRRHGRVCNIEHDLKVESEVPFNTGKHSAAMNSEGCKTSTELSFLDDVTVNLKEELRCCKEDKTDLEGKLEVARRDLSSLSMQLKVANQQLLEVSSQKELVLKDLGSTEGTLAKLGTENRNLVRLKDAMEEVVHVLETKKVALLQEVESGKTTMNELCSKYQAAQSDLASSVNEVKDLQAILQNVSSVDVQLQKAEEHNRNLESCLNAEKATAQDREEKLIASEWAVQQLALDVGKAKAALTQKDREEALMRDELADVERQLRAKEGTLIEMECYLEDALMSRDLMQTEVDQFRQRMDDLDRGAADWKRKEQDMTTRLGIVGTALEEKRAALAECELEIKRGNDQREVMKGAIDSIKLQLLGEQKTVSAQQKDMNRLCEDLERSRGEANSAYSRVKDLQVRLQQLEHSSAVRINQLQSSFSELKNDLSLAHHQLEKYQETTMLLAEESSRYKQKCEALVDLNTRKDSSLKDTEAQLLSVRANALEQSKMLEQRDRDLQQAEGHSLCQDERQVSLEDSLSRIQSQRCELQRENENLLQELRILRVRLDAASSEIALKSREIQRLQIQLDQKLPVAEDGKTQLLKTRLVDEPESSTQETQEIEARLCSVQASLHVAQEKAQVLQAVLGDKQSDPEMVMEQIAASDNRAKDIKEDLSKSQEALKWLQSALYEKSDIISVNLDVVNDGDVASWKEEAGSSLEGRSATQELDVTCSLTTESEKKTLKVEILEANDAVMRMEHDLTQERENLQHLAILEHDLNEERTKVAESAALIDDLQAQVEEWKRIADESAAEADKVRQDVLLIKEVMMSEELSRIEDRRTLHLLCNVEDDRVKERIKVVESDALIANLKLHVDGWKTGAKDAAKGGEVMNQELILAASTIDILMLQIKTRQAIEWAMKEIHSRLQVDIHEAREECHASKEKMQIFLHELGQSQDSEKKLLEDLQIEHNRLIIDLDNRGGFVCTFEIDACQKMPIQDHGNIDNIRAAKLGIGDDEISPKSCVEEFQISAENRSLENANNALEKELKILRLREESERQEQELAGKLDAAVSKLAANDLIDKQLNNEIVVLRSPVKKLKQEAMSLQDIQHGEANQCSTDTSDLARGRDHYQEMTGPGKWAAEVQKEVDYLELCDSLVRENVRLAKHLDGMQRKNRGLQKLVEGLQMKSSSDMEYREFDQVDCRPEKVLQGLSQKTNPKVLEKTMLSHRDVLQGRVSGEIDENAVPKGLDRCQISPGKVLGEIDENSVPRSLDRSQISQRPLVSRGGMM